MRIGDRPENRPPDKAGTQRCLANVRADSLYLQFGIGMIADGAHRFGYCLWIVQVSAVDCVSALSAHCTRLLGRVDPGERQWWVPFSSHLQPAKARVIVECDSHVYSTLAMYIGNRPHAQASKPHTNRMPATAQFSRASRAACANHTSCTQCAERENTCLNNNIELFFSI